MVGNIQRFICVVLLPLLACFGATSVSSASFDCDAAVTQAEINICSSERLSQLDTLIDQQWQFLDRSSRYFSEIQSEQLKWINSEDRFADGLSFEAQLEYLRFMNAMDSCLFTDYGTTNSFSDCAGSMRVNELLECETTNNQSTLSIGMCRGAFIRALKTIEVVETQLSGSTNFEIWNAYRDSECDWVAERWQGSIAGTIYASCYIDLSVQRISNIFNEIR
ncbi:DUF1311 domain-containing protein [Rhodobacterales bacterium LSUCC1028]|nr:DUF1311 domain-containing protein [Rhodobacterales bacterium LSUCC1028]